MKFKVFSNDIYLMLGLQYLYKALDDTHVFLHFIDVDQVGGLNEIYDYLNSPGVNEHDRVIALTRDSIHSRQFKKLGYISVASSLDEMKNIRKMLYSSSTPECWKKELMYYMNTDFLTPRQQDIISLFEVGMQSSEISATLGISVKTLYTHMERACTQYNAKNLAEFIFYKSNCTSLNKVV